MNKIDIKGFLVARKRKEEDKKQINIENKKIIQTKWNGILINKGEKLVNVGNNSKENTVAVSIGKNLKPTKKKKYPCPYINYCKKKFKSKEAVKQHVKDVHEKDIISHDMFKIGEISIELGVSTNIVLEKAKELKLNVRTSNSELSVDDANKLFEYIRGNLKVNINNEKKSFRIVKNKTTERYPCSYSNCNKSFSSNIVLTQHIKDVHKREKENQNKEDKLLNNKDKKIRCVYCEKSYTRSDHLNHLNLCIKNSKELRDSKKTVQPLEVKCQYCNKLIHKDYVDNHRKICSETNCEYCGKKLKKDNYQQHLKICSKYKEFVWEKNSSIKAIREESTTLNNIEKHQAIKYQYREDEELDPDLIDEEAYQKTFGTQLDDKSQQIRARVAFEHEKIYKQEEEDKSEIKIFLSKMYKGYCQVCGYTFKKTNGVNSFERFNWNDKRVVKVKKSLVSTADSLCLCRNCSANIKWGAFYPNFIDTIREIEEFKNKSYDEIKEKLHKIVDKNIPKIFEPLLEFDDVYALEIELDGKPRNIYFTNEHLLQFVTYLQKEDEVEEEVIEKKRVKEQKAKISSLSNGIYSSYEWLKREETIPLSVAQDFIRNSAWWLTHPSGAVRAKKHAYNVYKNSVHGWAIDFGANKFLVGKAIERCKDEINKYIEEFINGNKSIELDSLKAKLKKHISGAVATYNNGEYSGYYPIDGNDLIFGSQAIDIKDGANFLIRELGLDEFLEV